MLKYEVKSFDNIKNDKKNEVAKAKKKLELAKSSISNYVATYGQMDYDKKTHNLEFGNVLKNTLRGNVFPSNASNAYSKAIELFDFVSPYINKKIRMFDNACLPGDFVRAAIARFPDVDWVASSLKSGLEDRFGIIKNNPNRWLCHDNSGDIMDPQVFEHLANRKVDLYTSDLGFAMSYTDEEATQAPANARQIELGLRVVDINGCMIVKSFGCSHPTNVEALEKMYNNFEQTYVVKPLTSKNDNAECYYVGIVRRAEPTNNKITTDDIAINLYERQAKKIHDNLSIIGRQINFDLLIKYWRKTHKL